MAQSAEHESVPAAGTPAHAKSRGWDGAFGAGVVRAKAAVVRGAAALAIGLLLGAVLGRTLPAFIVGAAIVTVLMIWLRNARQAWTAMSHGWRSTAGAAPAAIA